LVETHFLAVACIDEADLPELFSFSICIVLLGFLFVSPPDEVAHWASLLYCDSLLRLKLNDGLNLVLIRFEAFRLHSNTVC
jgi:hypothetical protein